MTGADANDLRVALAAYDGGKGGEALPSLKRLGQTYPNNFAANEALGVLLLEGGDSTNAIVALENAARVQPANAVAQANLGAAYLEAGHASIAAAVLKKATALDPKNEQTLSNLGQALFQDKQQLAAANAFSRASALKPGDADIQFNWATALYGAGKYAEAATVLQRISKANENDAVQSLWGDVAERQGRYQDAVEHMQKAAQLNPTEANLYAVTVELLRHWAWEAAAKIATYGVNQHPESKRLQLAAGIAYFGSGSYPEASKVFDTLLTAEPNSEDYGSLLGKSCSASGGAAAPQCDAVITFADKHPENAQMNVYAGITILHKPVSEQHLDQVERFLRQAIQDDARIPEAYYHLAVLQQQKLQWQESAESLMKAVELRPTYAEAHYRLARAYAHTNRAEMAREETALQQKYAQQEKDETNAKLKEVTTFLMASH